MKATRSFFKRQVRQIVIGIFDAAHTGRRYFTSDLSTTITMEQLVSGYMLMITSKPEQFEMLKLDADGLKSPKFLTEIRNKILECFTHERIFRGCFRPCHLTYLHTMENVNAIIFLVRPMGLKTVKLQGFHSDTVNTSVFEQYMLCVEPCEKYSSRHKALAISEDTHKRISTTILPYYIFVNQPTVLYSYIVLISDMSSVVNTVSERVEGIATSKVVEIVNDHVNANHKEGSKSDVKLPENDNRVRKVHDDVGNKQVEIKLTIDKQVKGEDKGENSHKKRCARRHKSKQEKKSKRNNIKGKLYQLRDDFTPTNTSFIVAPVHRSKQNERRRTVNRQRNETRRETISSDTNATNSEQSADPNENSSAADRNKAGVAKRSEDNGIEMDTDEVDLLEDDVICDTERALAIESYSQSNNTMTKLKNNLQSESTEGNSETQSDNADQITESDSLNPFFLQTEGDLRRSELAVTDTRDSELVTSDGAGVFLVTERIQSKSMPAKRDITHEGYPIQESSGRIQLEKIRMMTRSTNPGSNDAALCSLPDNLAGLDCARVEQHVVIAPLPTAIKESKAYQPSDETEDIEESTTSTSDSRGKRNFQYSKHLGLIYIN